MRTIAETITLSFLLAVTNIGYSQQYISNNRSVAKKGFEKYVDLNHFKKIIEETDTTITFILRDPKVQNLDILLHFDPSGKCNCETTKLSCDSCFQKYLGSILGARSYKWTRVSNNTYLSGLSYQLILTTLQNTPNTFAIERSNMTRAAYKLRLKNLFVDISR